MKTLIALFCLTLTAPPALAISPTKSQIGEVAWRQIVCAYWPSAKLCNSNKKD